jgi:hypothetical protein
MLGKVEVITKEHAAAPTAGVAPRIDGAQMGGTQIESAQKPGPRQTVPQSAARAAVVVRGVVRAADDHRPIAGARVGIVPLGVSDITPANLIAWGGTNAEGQFELNKPAAPGRYTMKVRALGYQDFVGDVIVGQEPVVVEMHGSR